MATQPTTPTTIGRFRIEAVLGRGGMGEVYKAFDPTLKRTVAVKTVRPDINNPEYLQRLYREAQSCARLQHGNIVTIFEAGEVDGAVFVAMEYLTGETLSALIKTGALRFEETLRILIQLLDALDHAHREGVIHRDIKPANVLRQPDGKIKLLDFGLARTAAADPLTQSGTVMGTPDYMSPEQLRGEELDGRTDIFSLGVVAYEMVTGHRPFVSSSGDQASLLYRIVHEPPNPMGGYWPRVFPELEALIFRALSKPREERYATAGEMRDTLKTFLERSGDRIAIAQMEVDRRRENGEDPTADVTVPQAPFGSTTATSERPGSTATTTAPPQQRNPLIWVTGGLVATAAVAVAVMFLLRSPSPTTTGATNTARGLPAEVAKTANASPATPQDSPATGGSANPIGGSSMTAGPSGTSLNAANGTNVKPATAVAGAVGRAATAPGSTRGDTPTAGSTVLVNVSAKSLFAESSGATPASAKVGMRYRVIRQRGDEGAEEEVDPGTTTFRSGDRVWLTIDSNIDGHLYVIYKGSSGNWDVLFPHPALNNGRNDIRSGEQYRVPGNGARWRFDDNPGNEELFVLLSKEPVKQLPGFDRPLARPETIMASAATELQTSFRSRDLILETAVTTRPAGGGPAKVNYVVNRSALGKDVSQAITLKHVK